MYEICQVLEKPYNFGSITVYRSERCERQNHDVNVDMCLQFLRYDMYVLNRGKLVFLRHLLVKYWSILHC